MRGRRVKPAILIGASTLVVACGSAGAAATNQASATAYNMQVDELAAGKLDSLPTGTQFVRVLLFQQPPGASVPSRKHQGGLIYEQSGQQTLTYSDGTSLTLVAGQATYLASVQHSHKNTGSTTNAWYFIALWPSVQRGQPLVSPSPP